MQKIRLYILCLTVTCLVFGLGMAVLLNTLTPDRPGIILLFYFLFAVLVFAFTTLAGFFLWKGLGHRELANHYMSLSARQGLWFTLLLTLSLFMLSYGLFSWVSGGLLVLTLVFLESYLLTKNDRKP